MTAGLLTGIEQLVARPQPLQAIPQTNWQVVIGPFNTGPLYELSLAKQINLIYHVDDSATMTFVLDGEDPNLQFITELVTDCWVYRNGVLLFRGRIGSSQDTIDGEADSYTVQFNVFDYREWLQRQILQPSHKWSWRNQTTAQVIHDFFTYCVNGQSGIKPTFTIDTSLMPTSKSNLDFVAGTSVKEALGVMSGFGWQVIPSSTMGLTLRATPSFYYNTVNTHFMMEYGSTISKVTRNYDMSGYANSIVYSGDMKLAPIQSDAPGIASKPEGRMGLAIANPQIVDKAHLTSAATNAATRCQTVVPTWECSVRPGMWIDNTDAWIGDICQFIVNKGRIKINDQYRITDIALVVNDDSMRADDVTFTVAKPPFIPAVVR